MDFKRLGLFKIKKVVEGLDCKLELSKESQLHLVFYTLLLELALDNVPIRTRIELQLEQEPIVYNVKRILVERIRNKQKEYLIKWLGYKNIHNS